MMFPSKLIVQNNIKIFNFGAFKNGSSIQCQVIRELRVSLGGLKIMNSVLETLRDNLFANNQL